jgi:hypothetical protein
MVPTGFPAEGDTSQGGILHQAPTAGQVANTVPDWLQKQRANYGTVQSGLGGYLAQQDAADAAAANARAPKWVQDARARDAANNSDLLAALQADAAKHGQPASAPAQNTGLGAAAAAAGAPPAAAAAAHAAQKVAVAGGGVKMSSKVSSKVATATKDAAAGTPPSADTLQSRIDAIRKANDDPQAKAYMDGMSDRLAKQKKEDIWSAIAQIGFGMAASKIPYALQALGEAATAALPGMEKATQARRAAEADMAKMQMDMRRQDTALGVNLYDANQKVAAERYAADLNYKGHMATVAAQLGAASMQAAASKFVAMQHQPTQAELIKEATATAMPAYTNDPTWLKSHGLTPADVTNPQSPKYQFAQSKAFIDARNAVLAGLHQQQNPLIPGLTPGTAGAGGGGGQPIDFTAYQQQFSQ